LVPYQNKYKETHKKKLLEARVIWARANPVKSMLQRCRKRAKELKLPFNLTISDIQFTEKCPVFDVLFTVDGPFTASIDRIHNELGYVKGNVIIVSMLANRIKNNSTPEQLQQVAKFYERYLVKDDTSQS
jgi:hypothetical protein